MHRNSIDSVVVHLPILCGVASLVCLSTAGRILKSLNEPSLWLRHVIANWPNSSFRSFRARKLNERKSATNSTKLNCVSYMIEVCCAFTCQGVSEPPGMPPAPFLSFSLATHNRLRARYCEVEDRLQDSNNYSNSGLDLQSSELQFPVSSIRD